MQSPTPFALAILAALSSGQLVLSPPPRGAVGPGEGEGAGPERRFRSPDDPQHASKALCVAAKFHEDSLAAVSRELAAGEEALSKLKADARDAEAQRAANARAAELAAAAALKAAEAAAVAEAKAAEAKNELAATEGVALELKKEYEQAVAALAVQRDAKAVHFTHAAKLKEELGLLSKDAAPEPAAAPEPEPAAAAEAAPEAEPIAPAPSAPAPEAAPEAEPVAPAPSAPAPAPSAPAPAPSARASKKAARVPVPGSAPAFTPLAAFVAANAPAQASLLPVPSAEGAYTDVVTAAAAISARGRPQLNLADLLATAKKNSSK
jgi:hypothetical protein